MLDQVFEGLDKLMVNLNGKIDAVYTDLNSKFESLNTHEEVGDTSGSDCRHY